MRGVSVKVAVASLAFWCLFVFAGIASFIHGGIEQHMPGYVESIGFTASFAALGGVGGIGGVGARQAGHGLAQ